MKEPRTVGTAWRYIVRGLRLRCPLCGTRPMFTPWHQVRSLREWFTPLDGCPRCGYPYEREPGYFLMSVWALNYGFSSVFGLIIYVVLAWAVDPPVWTLIAAVLIPVFIFSLVFARHSKALFLAADLFFDPHERGDGDDGGNLPVSPSGPLPGDRQGRPVEPCRPSSPVR